MIKKSKISLVSGNYHFSDNDDRQKMSRGYRVVWESDNKVSHRFSAGDADHSSSLYRNISNLRRLPETRSLTFDSFES